MWTRNPGEETFLRRISRPGDVQESGKERDETRDGVGYEQIHNSHKYRKYEIP